LDEEASKRMAAALLEARTTPEPINLSQIARTHDVSYTSFITRFRGDRQLKAYVGPSKLLSDDDERVLVTFLELMADGGVGLNHLKFRQ